MRRLSIEQLIQELMFIVLAVPTRWFVTHRDAGSVVSQRRRLPYPSQLYPTLPPLLDFHIVVLVAARR